MKKRRIGLLRRYETILGVLIGAIPSLLFQIIKPDTEIPFSWFLSILTLLLIAMWFCFASRSHAISELEETREKLEEANGKIEEAHIEMESLTGYQNIEFRITHLNWDMQKIRFNCNVDTNLLSKGQCVVIYQKKDDFNHLCGIAHITEYDVYEKKAQANVLPLNTGELCDEPHPSMENVRLSPILDYDILDLFIKQRKEVNDE